MYRRTVPKRSPSERAVLDFGIGWMYLSMEGKQKVAIESLTKYRSANQEFGY
jgi:hypothetical protein